MAINKKTSSVKRFGPRYGRRLKEKFGKIEAEQKKVYVCPYCNQKKVRRLFAGVWHCKKCRAKFSGKAYTIAKRISIKEEFKA